jgi:hypothetical protein
MAIVEMYHEFTLSDEFRKNHFLSGLLLQELKLALTEAPDTRKSAVVILRNLLVKHSLDERYTSKVRQFFISMLVFLKTLFRHIAVLLYVVMCM